MTHTERTFPTELVRLILQHLCKNDLFTFSLVTKHFYDTTMPFLWKELHFSSKDTTVAFTKTMATSSRAPGTHIRSLSLQYKVSDKGLLALMKNVPFLEHLRLSNGRGITDRGFQHIPRRCPHLNQLYVHSANISQRSINALGHYCHQLSSLTLNDCSGLRCIGDLLPILLTCSLTCLVYSTSGLKISSMADPSSIVEPVALALRDHHHQLTCLHIQDNLSHQYYTPIITHGLTTWPSLTHLRLHQCNLLNDDLAIQFLQSHPLLETLDFCHGNITDATLDVIPVYLPRIKRLDVSGNSRVTFTGLCRLVKHCIHLEGPIHCRKCEIYEDDMDFPDDAIFSREEDYSMNLADGQVTWFDVGALVTKVVRR